MSRTHYWRDVSWEAGNAVDGSTSLDANGCGCCASTSTDDGIQWIQIILKRIYLIGYIDVQGRNDRK